MKYYKLTLKGKEEAIKSIGGKDIAEKAEQIYHLIENGKGFLLPHCKLDISHWACIITVLQILNKT